MSSIGDPLDPFDSLGIERGPEGQEVSYGYLLIPTKPTKERGGKSHTIDDPTEVASTNIHRPHHIVARYK